MVNPIKMLKSALTSAGGIDEALELLSSIGIEVQLDRIPLEQRPAQTELEQIAALAVKEGAEFYRLSAEHKGIPLHAFVVVGKPPL